MEWYPWLTEHYKKIISLYRQNKAHHTILISSSVELGSSLLIQAIGRWLMCQQPNGDKICGQCHGCQLMMVDNHPDWYLLIAENKKQALGIDAIRKLNERLFIHAQLDGIKAIWIPSAEQMTVAAANAFLKMLEESPANCYFILSTTAAEQLLATVRSRCLHWQLPCPDESYSLKWLQHRRIANSQVEMITALRLASGSPLGALTLLQADNWLQRQQFCNALLTSLKQQDMLAIQPLLDEKNSIMMLRWLSSIWLDGLKWQQGIRRQITNPDQQELLSSIAKQYDALQIQQRYQLCIHSRKQLMSVAGINQQLILTHLLCSL